MTNTEVGPLPIELQRITTQYIDHEDRIRLAGEIDSKEAVVLWLTRRLLDRLLPLLFNWLEQQEADTPRAEVLHSFAQAAARAALQPQAPVQTEAPTATWLVHSVDVIRTDNAIRLVFRSAEAQMAHLTLAAKPLRQWLAIMYEQFRQGDWGTAEWPAWMEETHRPAPLSATALH